MNLKRLYLISTIILMIVTVVQVLTYVFFFKGEDDVDPYWVERIKDTQAC